jgi:hypothetical protein
MHKEGEKLERDNHPNHYIFFQGLFICHLLRVWRMVMEWPDSTSLHRLDRKYATAIIGYKIALDYIVISGQ